MHPFGHYTATRCEVDEGGQVHDQFHRSAQERILSPVLG